MQSMSINLPSLHDLADRLLEQALSERGLRPGTYALFWETGDGRFMPIENGGYEVEESSGFLVDRDGHHFTYWFRWDSERRAPAITFWEAVEPQPRWYDDEEY